MTDDLEGPGEWRDTVETRLGKLLQSLHITQQDHTKRLTRLEDGMGEVTRRLGAVEGRLGAVEGRLTLVHVGVDAIKDLLTRNINQENPES